MGGSRVRRAAFQVIERPRAQVIQVVATDPFKDYREWGHAGAWDDCAGRVPAVRIVTGRPAGASSVSRTWSRRS